jgi:hypothetical protein
MSAAKQGLRGPNRRETTQISAEIFFRQAADAAETRL